MTTELTFADPVVLWIETLTEHANVRMSRKRIDTTSDPVTVTLLSAAEALRIANTCDEMSILTATQGRFCVWTRALGREVCFRADVPGVGA